MSLQEKLKTFKEVNFREIYQKFLYIECKELVEEMFPGELEEGVTGLFAYCYIDPTEGLSFRPFIVAKMSEDSVQVFTIPHIEDTIYVLRLREGITKMSEIHENDRHMYLYAIDPEKNRFIDLNSLGNIPLEDFAVIKEMVDEGYKVDDDREVLRSVEFDFLDEFRNDLYPDDVRVLLYDEKIGIEQVWVRAKFLTEKEIFGELLNEPYKDFGCHKDEIIGFVGANAGEELVLVYTGQVAKKLEN